MIKVWGGNRESTGPSAGAQASNSKAVTRPGPEKRGKDEAIGAWKVRGHMERSSGLLSS